MAPRKKTHRTATALMAAGLLSGLHHRPASAYAKPSREDRALSHDISRWLDERFADPWQARTNDRGIRRYAIPEKPLETVLAAYQSASGVTVTFPADLVRGITSPGVSGMFTAEQALARLLDGTSLTSRFTAPFAAVIEIRIASESVDVTATTRVVSPKFTEPLRDIPQTITVIPQALMEEQGATTLRDVLRNVPGITFQAGEGGTPAGDQMTIRGFSARTDMFIDGVRDFGGYSRDSFNLEQVEVAKGPASAIAGRGSTGGVGQHGQQGADAAGRHGRCRSAAAMPATSAARSTSISR